MRASFVADEKTIDAVVRHLDVIGEAVRASAPTSAIDMPDVDWKRLAGLRDVLIH